MTQLRRPSRAAAVAAAVTLVALSTLAGSAAGAPVAAAITTIRVGGAPDRVAVGPDAVWVGDFGNLSRVDLTTHRVTRLPNVTTPFAVDAQAVWARLRDRFDTIARIDPVTRLVVATFVVSGSPAAIAATAGAVWVADSTGTVTRIDPNSNSVVATIPLGQIAFSVAARPDAVWVSGRSRSSIGPTLVPADALRPDDSRPVLWRIDPTTDGVVSTIEAPGNCGALASGATATWAACFTVRRIDETLSRLVDTGADARTGLAVGEGSVWALGADGTVRRVDPATDRVTGTVRVPPGSEGIAAGGGSVWVGDPHLRDPATRDGTGTLTQVRLATGTR